MTILEKFYHGNIGFDSGYYKQDSQFVRAARVKHDSLEKQMAALNDSEKELFEQFCEAQGEIEGITHYNTFAYALRFGTLLMVDGLITTIRATSESVRESG